MHGAQERRGDPPIALEAVKRIDALFDIERGHQRPERRRASAPAQIGLSVAAAVLGVGLPGAGWSCWTPSDAIGR